MHGQVQAMLRVLHFKTECKFPVVFISKYPCRSTVQGTFRKKERQKDLTLNFKDIIEDKIL